MSGKPLEVGCIVEVLPRTEPGPPELVAERDSWTGRQLTVTALFDEYCDMHDCVCPAARTVPGSHGLWHVQSLRRIDPPDWEAPRVQEHELTT